MAGGDSNLNAMAPWPTRCHAPGNAGLEAALSEVVIINSVPISGPNPIALIRCPHDPATHQRRLALRTPDRLPGGSRYAGARASDCAARAQWRAASAQRRGACPSGCGGARRRDRYRPCSDRRSTGRRSRARRIDFRCFSVGQSASRSFGRNPPSASRQRHRPGPAGGPECAAGLASAAPRASPRPASARLSTAPSDLVFRSAIVLRRIHSS